MRVDVVLILDGPYDVNLFPKPFLLRLNPWTEKINKERVVKVDPSTLRINKLMVEWAKKNGVAYINPFDFLCSNSSCLSIDKNGVYVYKDPVGHLNPEWVMANGSYIDSIIE